MNGNTLSEWLQGVEQLYNKGFQFIDGLRFTNGAYINVGFRGSSGFGFDCDAIVDLTNTSVSSYADYQAIGASRYSLTYNANLFIAVNGGYNSAIFVAGSNSAIWNFAFGEKHHYEVRYASGKACYAKVDGTIIGGPVYPSWNSGNNVNEDVCIGRNSVSQRILGVVPIYDSKGDMVRRLQPAMRISDSEYGYLDTMHGIFYKKTGGSGTIERISEK